MEDDSGEIGYLFLPPKGEGPIYYLSPWATRSTILLLLVLALATVAALTFGEAVIAAFRAIPASDFLIAIAGSNETILRDADMAWHARVICAFRLVALTTLPPVMVLVYFVLLRSRPKPPRDEGARFLWHTPLFVVCLWYGLFFDNVGFFSYREWYSPPTSFLGRGILLLVACTTALGAMGLPLMAAVATDVLRRGTSADIAKSP